MCHHRRANNMFDWDRVFTNINLNGRVLVLNKTNLNMHSNFVSHESAIVNEKNPFFTKSMKNLIKKLWVQKLIAIVKTIVPRIS